MEDFAGAASVEGLDETDLAIANALQVAPRASWTLVGEVLGLSAATVARRWGRLVERGQAWVTATGSPELWRSVCNAFLDVHCEPGERERVALALARDPRTKSVMEVASGRDLQVNAVARDLPALSRFILDEVSRLPGVVKVDTQVSTRIYLAGNAWRLDALSRGQCERLQPAAEGAAALPGRLSAADHALLLALAADGRAPVTELAERTGASHTATRRRLSRLANSGAVAFRCEISQHLTGWPVSTLLWARVPHDDRRRICDQLARMPEVRQLVAISGSTNLLVSTWLHSTDSSLDLEERIVDAHPEFEIADHVIVLRTVKRQGWILDELGRKRECVPIDPWCDEGAGSDCLTGITARLS
ncbi:Lrp/AsnC family transcriptional regulator [Saccharopolyspora sp. NPDC002686]|uniref:Lrp/AsnC family transcriptional regulator n=1 Tax=Saccharopolyspora sp. NPDC002686 TaxID=3154541 RepID=UPI00331CA61F